MRKPITSARDKHPRGTLSKLLSAAWSPTWHGSQFPIAQDPFFNTADTTQFVRVHPSKEESTPAVADFRFRAPLIPRLVWPNFTVWRCYLYIITDSFRYCKRFWKIHDFFIKDKSPHPISGGGNSNYVFSEFSVVWIPQNSSAWHLQGNQFSG